MLFSVSIFSCLISLVSAGSYTITPSFFKDNLKRASGVYKHGDLLTLNFAGMNGCGYTASTYNGNSMNLIFSYSYPTCVSQGGTFSATTAAMGYWNSLSSENCLEILADSPTENVYIQFYCSEPLTIGDCKYTYSLIDSTAHTTSKCQTDFSLIPSSSHTSSKCQNDFSLIPSTSCPVWTSSKCQTDFSLMPISSHTEMTCRNDFNLYNEVGCSSVYTETKCIAEYDLFASCEVCEECPKSNHAHKLKPTFGMF